jgi:hypothetical protein
MPAPRFPVGRIWDLLMTRIREVVQQALSSGVLSIEAENQLRHLLALEYEPEDFRAFMTLQTAAMAGRVQQESRAGSRDLLATQLAS